MNLHNNARTTPHRRLLMVRRIIKQKQPAAKVADDFGVSERTVRKWRAGGEPALDDRSSAPARLRRLPPQQVAAIEALRPDGHAGVCLRPPLQVVAGTCRSSARCLHVYNVHRPHTALAGRPPISRLAVNILLGNDS